MSLLDRRFIRPEMMFIHSFSAAAFVCPQLIHCDIGAILGSDKLYAGIILVIML